MGCVLFALGIINFTLKIYFEEQYHNKPGFHQDILIGSSLHLGQIARSDRLN